MCAIVFVESSFIMTGIFVLHLVYLQIMTAASFGTRFCSVVENVNVRNDGKLLLHQHVNSEETDCVPLVCSVALLCLFN